MSTNLLPDVLFRKQAPRAFGVAVALVTDNHDPEGLGRVKIKYPWLDDDDESYWARVVSPMAGNDRGMFMIPEVDDEVLIAFEQGSMDYPYVLGGLWNGKDKPPESNSDGKNNQRTIKARSGHIIRLDDTDGSEKVEIIDKTGNNRIVIGASDNTITIEADGDITIKAGGKLSLSGNGVEVKSQAGVKVQGSQNIDVTASGQLNLKGTLVNLN
jgi:phage baseplate assembly protein V